MSILSRSGAGYRKVGTNSPCGEDELVHLPCDWTSFIADYALDDLVSADLLADTATRVIRDEREPLEKWLMGVESVIRARSVNRTQPA